MDLHWAAARPLAEERKLEEARSPLVARLVREAPDYDYRLIARAYELSREASRLGEFNVALAALLSHRSDQEPMLALLRALISHNDDNLQVAMAFLSDAKVPLTTLLVDLPPGAHQADEPRLPDMATVLRVEGMSQSVPSPDYARLRNVLDDLRREPRAAAVVVDLPPPLPLDALDASTGIVRVLDVDGRVALLQSEELSAWSADLLEERQLFWQQTLRWWTAEWLFGVLQDVLTRRLGYVRPRRPRAADQNERANRLRALDRLAAGVDDDDEDRERALAAIEPAELQQELRALSDDERSEMRRRLRAEIAIEGAFADDNDAAAAAKQATRDLFVLHVLYPLLDYLQQRFEDGSMLLRDIAVSESEVQRYALQYLELAAVAAAPNESRRFTELARWLRLYDAGTLRREHWDVAAKGRWSDQAVEHAWSVYETLDRGRGGSMLPPRAPAALKRAFVAVLDGELKARVLALSVPEGEVRDLWSAALGSLATGRLSDVLAETRRQASLLFWASRGGNAVRSLFVSWSAIAAPLRYAEARQQLIDRYVLELKRLESATMAVPLDVVLELDSTRSIACEARVVYTELESSLLWQRRHSCKHRFTLWRDGRLVSTRELTWPDVEVRQNVREPGLYWYNVERLEGDIVMAAGKRLEDDIVMAEGKSFVARITGTAFCRRTERRYDVGTTSTANTVQWTTALLPQISARRLQDAPVSKTHRLERFAAARLLARFLRELPPTAAPEAVLRRGLSGTSAHTAEVNRMLARPGLRFEANTASWWLMLTCMSRWRDFDWAVASPRGPYALEAISEYATKSLESFELLENAYADDCVEYHDDDDASLETRIQEAIVHVRSLSLSRLKAISLHSHAHQQRVRAALHVLGSMDVRMPRAQLELTAPALWRGRHSSVTVAPDAFVIELELRLNDDSVELSNEALTRVPSSHVIGHLSMFLHLRRGSVRVGDASDEQLTDQVEAAWQALVAAFGSSRDDMLVIGDTALTKQTLSLFDGKRVLVNRIEAFEQMLQVRRYFELRTPSHERLDALSAAIDALEDHYLGAAREE